MQENVKSKIIDRDYRVTRTCGGLWVEVLDYHAEPLLLSRDKLAEFGFAVPGSEADENQTLQQRLVEAEDALQEALSMLDRQGRQAASANARVSGGWRSISTKLVSNRFTMV